MLTPILWSRKWKPCIWCWKRDVNKRGCACKAQNEVAKMKCAREAEHFIVLRFDRVDREAWNHHHSNQPALASLCGILTQGLPWLHWYISCSGRDQVVHGHSYLFGVRMLLGTTLIDTVISTITANMSNTHVHLVLHSGYTHSVHTTCSFESTAMTTPFDHPIAHVLCKEMTPFSLGPGSGCFNIITIKTGLYRVLLNNLVKGGPSEVFVWVTLLRHFVDISIILILR